MVPTTFVRLDTLPLTPNGKVDRRKLPAPDMAEEEIVPPATTLEQQLFNLAAERLGTERFGVTSNLISLGLSSIAAMRLSIAIHREMGYNLPVKAILSEPTIRQMAEAIEAGQDNGQDNLAGYHVLQEYYPLTEKLRGVYIDWEMNRDTTQYNIPRVFRFKDMDAGQLAEALRKVVDAHSYIKTRFVIHDGEVMQQRRDEEPAQVSLAYLEQEPDTAFFQSRVRPFNPFEETLYRLEVYAFGNDTWLFKDFHHLISDGLSEEVFYNDLLTAYKDGSVENEELSAFDVALYEQELKKSGRYEEAQEYFDRLLEGTEAVSYPHSAHTDDTDRKSGSLTLEITEGEAIRNACRNMGITENAYFQTVVTQVLHRITREDGIMLATISAGRHLNGMEHMMGMFVKTIPLVSTYDIKENKTFAETAAAMHRQGIESVSRDFYPLTEIVERHGLKPQMLYAYQGGLYDGVNLDEDDSVSDIPLALDTQKLPIELTVWSNGNNGYTLLITYDTALYNCQDMRVLAQALKTFATHATKTGISLTAIELTTEEEQTALIRLGTGEKMEYNPSETLVSLFRAQAAKTPDNIAVVFKDRKLTYRELDDLTDKLAAYLITRFHVQPEEAVGVMIDRSELMVIYPLAIMKTGAAYMPLDFHFPEERLLYMWEDAEVRLLLSEEDRVHQAMPSFQGEVFTSDVLGSLPKCSCRLPETLPSQRYVILYTSGSTGKPKGVALEHHGIVNFCHWYNKEFRMTSEDRALGYSNFGFDAHMMDLYPAMTCGASVYISGSEMRMDIGLMNRYMEENAVSIAFLTTQIGHFFASSIENHSLRLLSVSGEKLMPVRKPPYEFYNCCGHTECTIYTTYYKVESDYDSSVIGRPLTNYQLYVVDSSMRLLPCGVAGELIICGEGVGRGYLHPSEKDAMKFTTFMGRRCYRTGD
ncbi:MAG: AMP-binding protein, partial [Bacteroidaceae bacterium]|nr:AMP-binding protein [Bacteroidaceae bacterium]